MIPKETYEKEIQMLTEQLYNSYKELKELRKENDELKEKLQRQ